MAIAGRSAGVSRRVQGLEEILGDATVADEEPATWSSYPWTSGATGLKLTCLLSGLRDVLTVARQDWPGPWPPQVGTVITLRPAVVVSVRLACLRPMRRPAPCDAEW